ncbi:MAG: DUF4338 domain-containing protein [Syntrophobacterales bacterium]|nr:DUF4338 domain-containing protein [Syntrophobacterales bacterium]
MIIQGRELHAEDIGLIRSLLAEHGEWCRTRISEELCRRWGWQNAQGRFKDMAARTLLLKLERAGLIQLPKRRGLSSNGLRNRTPPLVAHATDSIRCALRDLRPLDVSIVEPGSEDLRLFNCLLSRYHYLGHRNTVGENIRYLARDCTGRPVGCALFGSAAWKCGARDAWIGWDRGRREANLGFLTNNTRFLVLPRVTVPHLASHLLATLARRIRADWQAKYGHPVHVLETFVESDRFKGTCYRAANWLRLGSTQGRTRNDRNHCLRAPVKDVYLYPLSPDFRRELSA